jgi:hypothetical protein
MQKLTCYEDTLEPFEPSMFLILPLEFLDLGLLTPSSILANPILLKSLSSISEARYAVTALSVHTLNSYYICKIDSSLKRSET